MKTERTFVNNLSGTRNDQKPTFMLYKNITDRILKHCLLKVKVLYSNYLNKQSETGKLYLTPKGRIVKLKFFNINCQHSRSFATFGLSLGY